MGSKAGSVYTGLSQFHICSSTTHLQFGHSLKSIQSQELQEPKVAPTITVGLMVLRRSEASDDQMIKSDKLLFFSNGGRISVNEEPLSLGFEP